MQNCYARALFVRDGLINELHRTLEEHDRYLRRCLDSGKFSHLVDKTYTDKEDRFNDIINASNKVVLYLERSLNDLDSDWANIVYEDIEEMGDYDYKSK